MLLPATPPRGSRPQRLVPTSLRSCRSPSARDGRGRDPGAPERRPAGDRPPAGGFCAEPRMNPCPSARPGEGEQEENRQGGPPGLAASAASEDRGMPILFLLGVSGQSPHTPEQPGKRVAERRRDPCARDGGHGRDPESRIAGSKGLGSRQPDRRSRARP